MNFRHPNQLLLPWSPRFSVSVRYVAEKMLCVSVKTVCSMCQSGELLAYKSRDLKNSPYHVNYDSVIACLEKMHKRAGLEKRF
jgi:hypothetical protein